MNFLRRYSTFLIPAGIVVIAVILFIPTILIGRSVKKDMDESISGGNEIKSLVRKAPSKNQYKEEKLYQDQHAKEAEEVEKFAEYSSRRELISYDIFPEPKDTSQQIFIEFGRKFREVIDGADGLIKRMNALDAPSEVDIIKETERKGGTLSQRKRSSQRKKKKGTGGAMRDAVCRRRAEEISVYANPKLFKWYDFWEDYEFIGSETALQDCWYTQNSYWVYEDVVETIRMMNAGSDCVFTSPVKRLVGISFTGEIPELSERSRALTSAGFGDIPGYVLAPEDEPIGVQTWTGRKSGSKIDVIHFYLSVIKDADAVHAGALQRKRACLPGRLPGRRRGQYLQAQSDNDS